MQVWRRYSASTKRKIVQDRGKKSVKGKGKTWVCGLEGSQPNKNLIAETTVLIHTQLTSLEFLQESLENVCTEVLLRFHRVPAKKWHCQITIYS